MPKNKDDVTPDFFFEDTAEGPANVLAQAPLAVRMRPARIEEVLGQEHIIGGGKLLSRTISADRFVSMVFYGPPGTGKTTLARIISRVSKAHFVPLNAVASNVSEIRQVLNDARKLKALKNRPTIIFVDEIHRFNKSQQDVLMPDVEDGNVILIGATTQNPSFSINGPLLSRSTIFELRPLESRHLILLLKKALSDNLRGFGNLKIEITDSALGHIAASANGDARKALNALEVGVLTTAPGEDGVIQFTDKVAEESCQRRIVYYDGAGDYHFDTASAFIKSMRGSDVDASIYWLAKMLYAGEDPRFVVRRILILASEDIGNADPQALILASAGLQAVEFVGMPEAQIILSQLVTYMALAPKSNASYQAILKATEDVKNQKAEEVPENLRDSHYAGAKRLGHGQGYVNPHFSPNEASAQAYLGKSGMNYYVPRNIGFEKILKERLEYLKAKKA